MRLRPILLLAAAALVLAACHRKAEDPTVVTPDEQSQLNDAAATLDANAASPDTADGDDGGTGSNTKDAS